MSLAQIGEAQMGLLRRALDSGHLRCDERSEQIAAAKLHGKGLLARDPKDGAVWYPTRAAEAALPDLRNDDRDPGILIPLDQIEVGYRLRGVDPEKVESLMASIDELGLRTPISVRRLPGGRYRLSAGAHRLEAVRRRGEAAIACFVRDGDEFDDELWEIDENLCRADLTAADRAVFVFRRKEIYLLKHPETAIGTNQHAGRVRQVGEGSEGVKRFTAATAAVTGRSERSLQRDAERGEKISEKALRLLRAQPHLNNGKMLDRLKNLPGEAYQVRYIEEVLADERETQQRSKEIRTRKLKLKRAVRTDVIRAIAAHGKVGVGEMPVAAFPVGYADPPWEQQAYSEATGQDKGLMYPAMPLDEIKALCAGARSPFTPDAILFLWVTTNRLADGIDVLREWGFSYVSAITWDKVHIGMGRWVRDRTEHLLIGKRGNFPGLEEGSQPHSLISEVKGGHSRKPVQFAEIIDRLFPGLPKLELFQRRESLVAGDVRLSGDWAFWGNQAGTPESEAM
jgi:N6-adenosine-specific RNA methylase IME4